MRNFSEICLVAFTLLLSFNVMRLSTGELVLRDSVTAAVQDKPLGLLHKKVEAARRFIPEDARPHLVLGQELFAAAVSNHTVARDALLGMSQFELRASLRRNPADGAAWLTLALIAAEFAASGNSGGYSGASASRLAERAVRRRPGYAENAWIYARSLARGSDAQARAYRTTTLLEPRLTPKIVREIQGMAGDVTAQVRFVAPLAGCYRYWAWSVTSAVDGPFIATLGLQLESENADQTRVDHAWLYYYLGLKLAEADRPAQALPWFERALDRMETEQAFYRNYGFALLKSGVPRKAADQFRVSIELYPDLANASHLGLAQSSEVLGEKTSALAMYRRLAHNPRLDSWVRTEAGGGMVRLEKQR